jgi:lysozyme
MAFNLGLDRLLQFHDTLAAVREGQYDHAAQHMLGSLWAHQVGARADRLAYLMRKGELA